MRRAERRAETSHLMITHGSRSGVELLTGRTTVCTDTTSTAYGQASRIGTLAVDLMKICVQGEMFHLPI